MLIGGVVAYNVGWYYFFGSFSLKDALKTAMEEVKKPYIKDRDNENWDSLMEEERMTEFIKTLVYRGTSKEPLTVICHNESTSEQ